jgi:GT2 family glycosyltransferase
MREGSCEIIVVDDGSGAEEAAATEELCRAAGVTLLRQNKAGPATARNTGAAASRGRYLAFLDDDCEPASGWLKEIALARHGAPDAAFGGRTVNALSRNRYSAASQALIDYLYFYYADERNGTNRAGFFASNNLVVPAEGFRALGGFDETYPFAAGEDRDLCDRWLARGHSLVYLSGALVYHTHPMTFATFCKKHFDYGRGALRFHRDRARRSADRIRFEPVRFYANLLTWPFKQAPQVSPPTLAALLLVAQLAQASGFVFEASSRRARSRETSLPER